MASSSAAAKVLDIGVQPLPLNGMESLEPETHVCLDPTCTTCLATGVSGMAAKDSVAPCCEPCSSPGPSACGSESADSGVLQKTHVCLEPDCAQCKATGSTATHGIQNWNDEKERPHVCLDADCARCKATGVAIGARSAQGFQDWNAERKRPHVCLDPGCARCKATAGQPTVQWHDTSAPNKTHVCLDPDCARCKATTTVPESRWDQGASRPGKHVCGDAGCARCKATAMEPVSRSYNSERKRPHVCDDPSCDRCKSTAMEPPNPMVFADGKPRWHACLNPKCERCLATGRHPESTMVFADGRPRMHVCDEVGYERCKATGLHPPERNCYTTRPKMHVCDDLECGRCLATGRHPPERNWDSSRPKMHVCVEPDCERCLATSRHPTSDWDATRTRMHVCGDPGCARCKATGLSVRSPASWDVLRSTLAASPPPSSGNREDDVVIEFRPSLEPGYVGGEASSTGTPPGAVPRIAPTDAERLSELHRETPPASTPSQCDLVNLIAVQPHPDDFADADIVPVTVTVPSDNPLGRFIRIEPPVGLEDARCAAETDVFILDADLQITSSPVVVGAWLVFGVHYAGRARCLQMVDGSGNVLPDPLPYQRCLLGLYLPTAATDPQVRILSCDGGDTEGTVLFDPEECVIYWPHQGQTVGNGLKSYVTLLSALDFSTVARHDGFDILDRRCLAGADTSGVLTPNGYLIGTLNGPGAPCNEVRSENELGQSLTCGAVMLMERQGNELVVVDQIDYEDGFRTWVGGGLTAAPNGDIFIGGTNQQAYAFVTADTDIGNTVVLVDSAYHNDYTNLYFENRFGCSAVKSGFDARGFLVRPTPGLQFDPGNVPNCRKYPDSDFRASVAGEVPTTSDSRSVWAQFTGNNYENDDPSLPGAESHRNTYQAYRLDAASMQQVCEFVVDDGSDFFHGAKNYQAPTLQSEKVGFVLFNEPDEDASSCLRFSPPTLFPKHARLWRLGPPAGAASNLPILACHMAGYDRLDDELVHHSPTLVETSRGAAVLVATDKNLYVFEQDNPPDALGRIHWGHGSPHSACPVVHQGTTYLLSERGHLTILPSPVHLKQSIGEIGDVGLSISLAVPLSIDIDGYGDVTWPRFRADNCGSGRPNGASLCRS